MSLRFASFLRLCLLTVLLAGVVFQPQFPVHALTTLTVTPLTWNVIGLDSNNVNVGPNHFPVGARVCNTGGEVATDVTASFQWDSADPYINLRPGTLSSINLGTLNAGSCADAYFEVEVTRNSSAYNHTRRYRINVTAGNVTGTVSSPTPRELFVEYLVSQNRNAVTDVQYGTSVATLASVPAGGTMTLMVGNIYYIRLVGYTATQGYEQLESFINIPNTIFQVLSVSTTYTADSSATVSSPNDKAYGDACVWENDPNSPNYRACLSTGKVGGNITVTYQVRILQVPGAPLVNPVPLSTLIYDFSGSSYHYNADYSVSTRYANIVNANLEKSFSPKLIAPNANSTLTFTINNPGPAPITDVNFADLLPSGVTVVPPVTTPQCGGTVTLTTNYNSTGRDRITFTGGTVAGLSSCAITVTVTSGAEGIYNNTTDPLYIGTTSTGDTGSDTLVVSSSPPPPTSCSPSTTIATWNFNSLTTGINSGPFTGTLAVGNASGATATYGAGNGSTSGIANSTSNTFPGDPSGFVNPVALDGNVWGISNGWLVSGTPTGATLPYFQFQVNAINYGGLTFSARVNLGGSWSNGDNWYVLASTDGSTWTQVGTGAWATNTFKNNWGTVSNNTSNPANAPTTYFRIYVVGSQNNKADDTVFVDNVSISGCANPPPPTISKSFGTKPLVVGSNSQLTFTIANTGANATNLTGVSFVDALPGGLELLSPEVSNTCGGTLSLNTATNTIQLTDGVLNAAASCTIIVNVQGGAAGSYINTSTNITSTQTGANPSATPNVGFARDTIDVIAPPVIAKAFTANPIFTGETTLLTFTINNPNPSIALSNLSFTDTLPAGLVVDTTTTAPSTPATNTCGGTLTANDGATSISLGGTSTLNAGATCTITVRVRGVTTGLKENSVQVSSTNGGTGNTDTADVLVKDPARAINLLKQVGPTASGPWTSFLAVTLPGNVYYRFVVENVGDLPLSAVDVTDPTVSAAACSWVDGDGTALIAPFNLPVANANDDQLAICVLGPVTAAAGSNPNTATADDNNPGLPSVSDTSTATYGTTALTLDKTAAQANFTAAGETLNYSYLVTNSGFAPLLGPVTVTDDKVTVSCPDVSTVGDGDNWLDIGESLTCTATYTVTADDVAAGFVTNTASATAGGVTSNTDSKTVSTPSDLTVSKTNNVSGSVAQNGTFNWTITVSNIGTGVSSFADSVVILSDPLPGADGYYPQGALTIVNGGTPPTGTINCSITGSALSCAASGGTVTLPAGASFSVTFAVTPTASGSLANTATVDPGGNVTETDETNNTASDSVSVIAPPSISKSFGAANIPLNGTTTLSFTITNPNAGTALTGVAFTDTLPAGLTVASATSAQCGGTLTVTATDSIALTGGTIAAGGSCTFDVTVTGTTAGVKNNTTGAVTSTNGGTGNTASASTTVVAPPSIVKTFGANPITVNGTAVITFTITNPAANTVSLTGVSFTDTYPAGLQNAAAPNASTTCVGGAVTAAANGPSISLSGATLAANSSCTVTVTVTATTAGTKTNSVTVSSTNGGTGNTSTANLGVISAAKTVVAISEDSTTGNDVAIGEVVRYRLVIDLPEGTTVNLQLLDNIVANMAYLNDGSTRVAFICNSGPACASSSTPTIGSNPVISGNTVVTPTFVLPAAAITGGTGNPFPDGDNPLFSLGTVTNNDNDSDAEYVVLEFNSLVRNTAGNNNGNTRGNTFTVNVNGSALITTTSGVNDQVTIREPEITAITKSITASPTDAGDTITYQLQFTNSGTAPAFDITVTDALNAVLTAPVTVSGSTTGGDCGSTVSTVSGSYSAPNATATVTCLAAGGTATVNITATVSSTALAGYTFGNSGSLVYTSLPGTGTVGNPTGSTTPGASGTTNGERNGSGGTNDYVASSNTVSTTLASPSLAKAINPAGTEFAIGATIPYQITITVPEGVTGGPIANLVDTIPDGLSYVPGSLTVTPQAGVTIGTAGPYTDANAAFFNLTGPTMTLTFGSFTSTASGSATNRTITVAFLARVDNIVGNQSGTTFTNSADFTRTNPNAAGTLTLNAAAPAVSVIEPDLNVSKAVSSSTPSFNSTLTYTLTVEHTGASNSPAYDAVITDTLPAGLTGLTNVAVTSAAPADCATGVINNSTASALNVTVGTMPLGCTVTITYDVSVSGAVGSTQTNSVAAAWTSGAGSVSGERTGADGPGGALNDYADTASQTVTVSGPDFSVVKTDGSAVYTPGTPITYTITVSNTGNAVGTGTVTDNFPASLTNITWTCVGTGGATCTANGTGNINDAVSIPAGQSVTYTVNATVLSSATGNLVNTASAALSVGTDPTPGNNSSTDTDTPDLQADLQVVKTDGADSYIPGGTVTYTITVTNNGPSDVTGASFSDAIPSQVTEWTWTCVPGAGASCSAGPATSSADFTDAIDLPAGSSVTYTVVATIGSSATGDLVNTATVTVPTGVTDPVPGNNSSTDTNTFAGVPALTISKTETSTGPYAVGDTITYSVVVTNTGTTVLTNVVVSDPQLTPSSVTCLSIAQGGTCTLNGSYVVTQSDVDAGSFVNTASVTDDDVCPAAGAGVCEDSVTVTFAQTPAHTTSKTETSTGPYAVGDTITYDIVVTNTGNVTLTGVTASDNSAVLGTCTPAQPATLTPGASMTCPASHVVTQADVDAGSYVNTATGDTDQTTPSTSTVTVTFPQNPAHTTSKTETSTGPYAVGDTITYNIVVTNTGNVTLTGVTASDSSAVLGTCTPAQPATLTPGASMTCPASHVVTQADVDAGSYVNTATGDTDQTTPSTSTVTVTFAQTLAINIAKTPPTQTILSGDSANFTLTVTNVGNVTLSGVTVTDAQCTTGPTYTGGDTNNDSLLQLTETWTYSCSVSNVTASFTNTASVNTTQGATDSDSANVIVTILQADLSLDKSVSNSTPLVATNIDFTLSVTNSGPDTATGVQVTDVIPSGFAYVSHSASQGTYNSGTGVWNVGTLVINQTATLTITVTVNISGSYTNYAEITASDVVDPDSTPNNGSTNEDDDASVTVTPTQNDPSGLTKTVSASNQAFTTHPNVAIGEILTYQVSVTVPPGVFDNARLVDTMERGLAYMDCVSIDGAGLTTSVAGSFASVCSTPTVDDAGGGTTVDVGRRVTYDFGTLTNSTGSDQTLVITYRTVVLDSAGNVSGVDLENSAVWAWSGAGSLGPASTSVNILEPDLSITKTASASLVSVGSEITITLRIQHTAQSETNAYDVIVTDVLPAQLDYVAGTLECVSGAQDANICNYNAGTRTISAVWNAFTLGGGNGQVTFRVRVVSLPSSGITNVANVAWSSLPGDVSAPQTPDPVNVFSTERDYDPASQIDVYGASATLVIGVFSSTPSTGFAPNVVTDLGNSPREMYSSTGGVRVEIPSLGINILIVGVPLKNGEWNVSWLGNQAGWLEGSAFPSWSGNSVLTSHVYLSNGLPGPFVNLSNLKFGDKIIIHAYGQRYVFEVRANTVVEPNDASIFRHEEKSWLTLVTCKEYDEKTNTYEKRVVVRAVLVGVER
jgi:LPXTG-site transpeptidase (sortase) family protein